MGVRNSPRRGTTTNLGRVTKTDGWKNVEGNCPLLGGVGWYKREEWTRRVREKPEKLGAMW